MESILVARRLSPEWGGSRKGAETAPARANLFFPTPVDVWMRPCPHDVVWAHWPSLGALVVSRASLEFEHYLNYALLV